MTSVDILLLHGYVVTMDGQMTLHQDGGVAVRGDTIVAVGPTHEISANYQAGTVIDCTNCIISPGLINAHTHAPMTLLRGLADDLRLDVWLYGYMMPVERDFVDYNFCYTGTLLACAEMLRSGVTTFCDMYYNEAEVARATVKAGMRAVLGQTLLKFQSPDATSYDQSLEYCRSFIEQWLDHPLIIPAVAPHAPYTATPDMIRSCVELACEYDVPLHIHIAETAFEQQGSQQQYGMTVVPWLAQYDLFKAKVIAAHCVHLEDGEMHTLHQAGTGVAHCPSANLKLASGVAPVQKMIDLGLSTGIGTDGPASNNDLDMFEETRLAALLQKGVFGDPTSLPAKNAWRLATIDGAKALHIDHLIGSLEADKRADIAIINADGLHQMPRFNRDPEAVYARLVYATKATDVRDVLVNGQLLMRERNLLTLDETQLVAQADQIARRIDGFLTAREDNILSKLLAISADFIPQETFEIQVKVEVGTEFALQPKLTEAGLEIIRPSTRVQYDTYFTFDEANAGRLRFREDEIRGEHDELLNTFYTMTLMGPTSDKAFENSILLTRARYTASARHSLRFYREYFRPTQEYAVVKHRQRCHINFHETDLALNLDQLNDKRFLEIKCRTWSAKDATFKADLLSQLLEIFGFDAHHLFKIEYVDLLGQAV